MCTQRGITLLTLFHNRQRWTLQIQAEMTAVCHIILDAYEACFDKTIQYNDISSECCTVTIVLDPRLKLDFYFEKDRCAEEMRRKRMKFMSKLRSNMNSSTRLLWALTNAPMMIVIERSVLREEEGESSDASGIFDFVPSGQRGTSHDQEGG
jgi:hypothetical protein